MVDEAHATGALGPGGRGSVAAAGLERRGRRGRRHPRQGARLLRRLRLRRSRAASSTCSTRARPFIFSTAPPPPVARRGEAALELLEAEPAAGRAAARQRARRCARRWPPRGSTVGGSRDARSSRSRSARPSATMALCERLLERGVFAQGIRPPTVPEGSSRLRFTVMATHREAELRGAAGWSARRRGSWVVGDRLGAGRRRRRRARLPRAAWLTPGTGSSSPAPAPRSARRSSPRRSRGRCRARASGSRSSSPRVTGLDELAGGEPDHELLRRAAGSAGRATRRSRPTATGRRLAAPGRGAGRRGDRAGAAARGGARGSRRGADVLVCEGVGGLLVPLAPDYLVRDLAVDLGLPLVVAASPGLGTINHTLLTIEAARAAGLEVAAVVLTPWPERAGRDRALKPRDDRRARRGRGRDAAAARPRRSRDRWPSVRFGAVRDVDHRSGAIEVDRGRSAPADRLGGRLAASPRRPSSEPPGLTAASAASGLSASSALARIAAAAITAPASATAAETPIALLSASTNCCGVGGLEGPAAAPRPGRSRRSTATPRLPPTMRNIESTPEAMPAFSTATAFIAALVIGDIVSAMPIPSSMKPGSRSR